MNVQTLAQGLRRCLGAYVEVQCQGHRWRGALRLAVYPSGQYDQGEQARFPPCYGLAAPCPLLFALPSELRRRRLNPRARCTLPSWTVCVLYTNPKRSKVRDRLAPFSLPAPSALRDANSIFSSFPVPDGRFGAMMNVGLTNEVCDPVSLRGPRRSASERTCQSLSSQLRCL